MANPSDYKIPDWMLNRRKDIKDGKTSQIISNALDSKLRDDLERLKKIRYPPHPNPPLTASAFIVVFATSGAFVSVASTPAPPAAAVRPSVCPRSAEGKSEGLWPCGVAENKQKKNNTTALFVCEKNFLAHSFQDNPFQLQA
jgi:hypothetical protein